MKALTLRASGKVMAYIRFPTGKSMTANGFKTSSMAVARIIL